MPYRKYNQKTTSPSTSEFFNKIKGEIQNLISEREFEFYELEPVEVIDILLDEKKLPKSSGNPDYKYYGAIKGRWVENKKQTILPLGEVWILPLDPHIKNYPVIGENVVCVNHLGRTYYTTIVNYKNNPNNNKLPGLSSTGKGSHEERHTIYEGGTKIQRQFNVKANPGDFILQGRYGNSINIGSQGLTESSIKLVAGHNPNRDYDITKDGASIYIQDGGSVEVMNPNDKINTYKVGGKKIILDADYIVLNAKKNIKIISGDRTEIIGKNLEFKHNEDGKIFTGETQTYIDNQRGKLLDRWDREVQKCIDALMALVNPIQEDYDKLAELQQKIQDIPTDVQAFFDTKPTVQFDEFNKLQTKFVNLMNEREQIPFSPQTGYDPIRLGLWIKDLTDVLRGFANPETFLRFDIVTDKKK